MGRIIVIGLAAVAGFFITHAKLPYAGPLLWAFILWSIYTAIDRHMRQLQRIAAAKRIEPLFIIGRHPETDEPVYLPAELEPVVMQVPYRKVRATVEYQKHFHTKYMNGFMLQKNEKDHLPIQPIFPFHGENVNETWPEYQQRCIDTIKFIRAAWHERMKERAEWYERFHHQQQQ